MSESCDTAHEIAEALEARLPDGIVVGEEERAVIAHVVERHPGISPRPERESRGGWYQDGSPYPAETWSDAHRRAHLYVGDKAADHVHDDERAGRT